MIVLDCTERLQEPPIPEKRILLLLVLSREKKRGGRKKEKDEVRAWSEGLAQAPTCSDRLLKFNASQSLPRTWFHTFAFLALLMPGFCFRSLNREI